MQCSLLPVAATNIEVSTTEILPLLVTPVVVSSDSASSSSYTGCGVF